MSIISIVTDKPGNVGVVPRRIEIKSTDNLATVSTAGYVSNSIAAQVSAILPTDIVDMIYNYNPATNTGSYAEFVPSFSGNVITLVVREAPNEVIVYSPTPGDGSLALQCADNSGNFANVLINESTAQATTWSFPDPGVSASKVILDNSADTQTIQSGNLTVAGGDITVSVGGLTVTEGELLVGGELSATGGIVSVGDQGTPGEVIIFPPTSNKGGLRFQAADNTGDTITIITNAFMGQASTIAIPDPGAANAQFTVINAGLTTGHFMKAANAGGVLADGGFSISSGVTPVWGGGATSHDFTVTGLPSGAVVVTTMATGTTSTAAIAYAQAISTNTLRVIFTVDPGANTSVNWIATKV